MVKEWLGSEFSEGFRNDPAAVSLALRDMGNGVTRVESLSLHPTAPLQSACEMWGGIALVFPLPDRIVDALEVAMLALDVRIPTLSAGCFRFVTANVTEFFLW